MNIDSFFSDLEKKMEAAMGAFAKELSSVRTGRASTSLLDGIKIDYYGTPTPIAQVASLSVPESRTILIQAWDKPSMQLIEKAILESDLGLNPMNDGKVIRIPIPALTEERRKELVKVVKRMTEDKKVVIRNIRRDGIEGLKKMEKDKKISEDENRKGHERIQKLTDLFVKKIDEVFAKKELEVLKG